MTTDKRPLNILIANDGEGRRNAVGRVVKPEGETRCLETAPGDVA